MEKQDLDTDTKELEYHLRRIDKHYKNPNRVLSPRLRNPQFQISVFDFRCGDVYRVFKNEKILTVFYTEKDGDFWYPKTKQFNLSEEQVNKLEKYFYS